MWLRANEPRGGHFWKSGPYQSYDPERFDGSALRFSWHARGVLTDRDCRLDPQNRSRVAIVVQSWHTRREVTG